MSFRSAIAGRDTPTGLEDLSAGLNALRIQGPQAVSFLVENGISCPGEIFAVSRAGTDDSSTLVARIGSADVIVQSDRDGTRIDGLRVAAANAQGVLATPDEGARLRLSGPDADRVWRQTCGVEVETAPVDRLIYTRVAGVSCAILPEAGTSGRSYQVWVDYSLAPAVWESLAECFAN